MAMSCHWYINVQIGSKVGSLKWKLHPALCTLAARKAVVTNQKMHLHKITTQNQCTGRHQGKSALVSICKHCAPIDVTHKK